MQVFKSAANGVLISWSTNQKAERSDRHGGSRSDCGDTPQRLTAPTDLEFRYANCFDEVNDALFIAARE